MKCDTPFYVEVKGRPEKVPVPCGKCPPCKKRRVDSWVFRCMQEEKQHDNAHFITLTYDTRFVPISPNGFMTLDKGEFPRFMKRLRKLLPSGHPVKYYACGEYGTQRHRPHYHAIVFGVPDPEMFFRAWTLDGDLLGKVDVGTVTNKSVAYTMKYIDKSKWKAMHGRDDRVPEFSLMSKGLGKSYLTSEIVAYHKADVSRLYCTHPGGHRIAMPRYYRQKIYSEDDLKQQVVLINAAAEHQMAAERLEFLRLYADVDGYTFEDYLESKRFGRYENFYNNQKSREL